MKNILIVDDQEVNRKYLSWILKKLWNTIKEAENWAEAVRISLLEKFDYIFMDIEMPILDWIKASKIIKENCLLTKNSITKIIWCSSKTDEETKKLSLENWMDHYFHKHCNINIILDLIK